MDPRPPVPPFTRETAAKKVQAAEDAWNSRDPVRCAGAYTVIAVNVGDVIGSRIFVDPGVIKHRRVVDALSVDGYCENIKIA